VASVSARKAAEPHVVEPLLSAIQDVSDEARRCFLDADMSRSDQISVLESLIDHNHSYLVQLGVSHAALEAIRAKTASEPFGLHTKLTGAGGGGCAYTLIPDGLPVIVYRDTGISGSSWIV
jgi:mevalonate kinase